MEKELQFPIVYDLRIIYGGPEAEGLNVISRLLKDLAIDHRDGIVKPGGKENLIRLSFNVTILSKEQMNAMYNNLNTLSEVKWAT